jgi:hypothetical protein
MVSMRGSLLERLPGHYLGIRGLLSSVRKAVSSVPHRSGRDMVVILIVVTTGGCGSFHGVADTNLLNGGRE